MIYCYEAPGKGTPPLEGLLTSSMRRRLSSFLRLKGKRGQREHERRSLKRSLREAISNNAQKGMRSGGANC